jgi:hypothetical protein
MKMIGWFEFDLKFDLGFWINAKLEVMTDGVKYYGYSNGDTVHFFRAEFPGDGGYYLARIEVIGDEFFLMGKKTHAVKCEYPKDSSWAHETNAIYTRFFLLMDDGTIKTLFHYRDGRCLVDDNGTLKPLTDIKTGIVRVAYHQFL